MSGIDAENKKGFMGEWYSDYKRTLKRYLRWKEKMTKRKCIK